MKIESLTQLGGKAVTESAGVPDDFLARADKMINNLKTLVQMAGKIQGLGVGPRPEPQPQPSPKVVRIDAPIPQPPQPGFLDYLDLACNAGMGDKTINAILAELGTRTLNEIREVFKNVAKPRG